MTKTSHPILRVGIVGAGEVVRSNYSRSLPKTPGISIEFVSDIDFAAAEACAVLFGAQPAGPSGATPEVDAIIIATPPSTHRSLVEQWVGRVKVIVCEKPFVGTEQDARDLVDLASAKNTSLRVAHLRRVFPAARAAKALIETGVLGEVHSVEAFEGGRFTWYARSNYVNQDRLGGVLFDTGSHTIDLALFVCGFDELALTASVESVNRDRPEPSHEIDARVWLTHTLGTASLRVRLSRFEALANLIRIHCANATLTIPTGPRDGFRLDGPKGMTIIQSMGYPVTYDDAFAMQWREIFSGSPAFDASRFVGLSRVLEVIGEASE